MTAHQLIKEYVIANPGVSLTQLSKQLSVSEEQMREFLDLWVKSGVLNRISPSLPCKKGSCACTTCVLWSLETYKWI
jgi:predicted HTH transcriptional regulator